MFCAPGIDFGGAEGVVSRFHVLRARTRFRRYRGRPLPFSSFTRPDLSSAVPRASGPVFKFCSPGLVFGCTEGVVFRFHILRARTRFWRYRGRWCPCSCFAHPSSISAVPRLSAPVFMFCAPGLGFDDTDGVMSRFHVLGAPDSFSAIPRASCPVFIFCAPGIIFGGVEGVVSRFHVLRARTRFRRYRGRRLPFSCFARPNSFSAVSRASCPVFMFCGPRIVFDGTEGVGVHFHILRARTSFRRYRWRRHPFSCFARSEYFSAVPRESYPVFMFCVLGLVFRGTEGVVSCFQVLRARTRFRRYRGRWCPFSCFARPNSISAVPRLSAPIFMFCAPGLGFDGTEGVQSRFHVLRARTRFRRYRGRHVPFSCFARPDLVSAVPRASTPVFMLCAPGLGVDCFEGVMSRFHDLHAQTRFRRYRGRPVLSRFHVLRA
jgi:hypothetical protein